MTLAQLKEQANQIILQRSQLKDQLEQMDKLMAQVGFAMQVLEAQEKAAAAPAQEPVEVNVEVD